MKREHEQSLVSILPSTIGIVVAVPIAIWLFRVIRIDDCLDDGGHWSYELNVCIASGGEFYPFAGGLFAVAVALVPGLIARAVSRTILEFAGYTWSGSI